MLTCYAQPGKARSRDVLGAFATGWRGGDAAAFYGVVGLEEVFAKTRESAKEWLYGDNAFFDRCRGRFFRFARCAFQISEAQRPDFARLNALGIWPAPWRRDGRHVVVVEQSPHFLGISDAGEGWLERTVAEIGRHTDRPVRVRAWSRDKAGAAATLAADLEGAWALVTHSSAAAVEAVLAGVPAYVSAPCAATPMALSDISRIEDPARPDDRAPWAAGLAGAQWTVDELKSGLAWRRIEEWRRAG